VLDCEGERLPDLTSLVLRHVAEHEAEDDRAGHLRHLGERVERSVRLGAASPALEHRAGDLDDRGNGGRQPLGLEGRPHQPAPPAPLVAVHRRQAVAEERPDPPGRRVLAQEAARLLQHVPDEVGVAHEIDAMGAERQRDDVAVRPRALEKEPQGIPPRAGEDAHERVGARARRRSGGDRGRARHREAAARGAASVPRAPGGGGA